MPPQIDDPMASSLSARLEESHLDDINDSGDEPIEHSIQDSQQTQTQLEFTQLTQTDHLTPDESSNLFSTSSSSPLSPPPVLPWGRLVPCVPSAKLTAVEFLPNQTDYWLGRSNKCDVKVQLSTNKNTKKNELVSLEWGKSMISNRHCRIFQQAVNGGKVFIEDNSGNGTFINQQTHLRKGDKRILHSGDEICLVNMDTLRKKITSNRVLQLVLQQFTFIFVQSKPRKPCVNPRAMNYKQSRSNCINDNNISPTRRIERFYDILEVLGDGTSGQVRRAIHRQSGQEFAVKIISLRRQLDMSMMEREVHLLQKLDHPYIVQLVDVFVQHGVAMYLVMELVKGGDLFDHIVEKQRYTEVEARRAMRRLLSAVYYLHEHCEIVHRDLKPENILCSSPTHVKLADFGLAKIVKADGLKTFCGTPAYFAPEVFQRRSTVAGEGRYGKPADMWSLGVILYILLTGTPPFDADIDEPHHQFEIDFEADDASLWGAIPMAQDLVQQMLRLDPKRRLTVRQACDHPWINIEDGDTHCHPLDDPAVTTKKRLFDDDGRVPGKQVAHSNNDIIIKNSNDASSNCSIDDESLRSRDDSILSKEEFAQAAVSNHSRNESVFHFDVKEQFEERHTATIEDQRISNAQIANIYEESKMSSNSGHRMDIGTPGTALHESNIERPNSPSPRDVKQMSIDNEKSDNDTDKDINKNFLNDAVDLSNPSEGVKHRDSNECLDVSPFDQSCYPPRSPLAKLNLNERCNRFRDQVLNRTDNNNKYECQTAVTPTLSNVKRQEQQRQQQQIAEEEAGDEVEDPILSQFSSDPSSVDSFGDSSASVSSFRDVRGTTEETAALPSKDHGAKKRRVKDESELVEPPKSKRPRSSCSKQTTLKSWLVKKEA